MTRGRRLEAQPAAARRGARAHERRRGAPDRLGQPRRDGGGEASADGGDGRPVLSCSPSGARHAPEPLGRSRPGETRGTRAPGASAAWRALRVRPAGPEWSGGGLLAARAALDDVDARLLAQFYVPRLWEHPVLADEAGGNGHSDSRRPVAARRAAFWQFCRCRDLGASTCSRAPRPDGELVLGQVDWDEGKCRVIDARGDGVPRGTAMPLARGVPKRPRRR